MPQPKRRRLTLRDLVDLELQLARDRTADPTILRHRDATVGRRLVAQGVDPRQVAGPPLFLAWLDALREREEQATESSAGERTERLLGGIGVVLFLLGCALGVGAVAAWLAHADGRPINVIFFFASILGLQMPLLLLWVVAALPDAWLRSLPGVATVQWLLRAIGQLPPRIIAWTAGRISGETNQLIARLRGELTRWNWIYGRLQVWILVRLTQVFAVAFNLGAVASFVVLSYGSDPAFGWKSTLMTPEQLHALSRVVAAPWSLVPADWSASPTLAEVRATRFWSLDEKFHPDRRETPGERPTPADPWARWWPFLLTALVCYGLLPRLVTLGIAAAQVRRSLAGIRLDHSEFLRLSDRLSRLEVDTQATTPEAPSETSPPAAAPATAAGPNTPLAILSWLGDGDASARLQDLVASRLAAPVRKLIHVGGLDPAGDLAAVADASRQIQDGSVGQVAVVVEAWEPPVGDYLDFLTSLRKTIGRGPSIRVLLFDRDASGHAAAARPDRSAIWQDRLATLGDPWLTVDSLVEGTSSARTAAAPAASRLPPEGRP